MAARADWMCEELRWTSSFAMDVEFCYRRAPLTPYALSEARFRFFDNVDD